MSDNQTDLDWEQEIIEARKREEEADTSRVDDPEDDIPDTGFDNIPEIDDSEAKSPNIESKTDKQPTNLKEYFYQIIGDPELADKLAQDVKLTKDQEQLILEDKDNVYAKFVNAMTNFTREYFFQESVIRDRVKEGANLTVINKDPEKKDKFSKGKNARTNNTYAKTVARLTGIKRLYLVHSGFHIDIRRFTNDELRSIMVYVDEQRRDIGKILGSVYYVLEDIFFIKAFVKLLPSVVIDSNLKNFRKGDTLIKAISYSDLRGIIVHGMLTLMFREGISFDIVCPNTLLGKCTWKETRNLDLNNIKLVDMNKMPKEAWNILLSENEFTIKTYQMYQKLINSQAVIKFDDFSIHMRTPSVHSVLTIGEDYTSRLISAIYDDNGNYTDEELLTYRSINYYKTFAPWIQHITYYKETGEIDYQESDIESIYYAMESDLWEENPDKARELTKFLEDSLMVFFGYYAEDCPVCKYKADETTNNIVPIDLLTFFFNLSVVKLISISKSRTQKP